MSPQNRLINRKERVEMSEGALKNIKVLDMGRVLAGPICTAMLGDLGADVIKIEDLGGDKARNSLPEGGYFAAFNHSKRGVTLNLKSEKGREIFCKLIKEADVVVENFRPGVMKKLGLDYEYLKTINPGLIYAAVSGFGQEGPYSQRAGYDPVAQGMSGIMSVTGFPGNDSVRCGASICDVMAGMQAVIGILAALNYRTLTGEGQKIDVALIDMGVVAMSSVNQVYLSNGTVPGKMGNGYAAGAPGGCYKTSDGEAVLAPNWEKLCGLMDRKDLLENPLYADRVSRVKNRVALDEIVTEWTKTMTTEELVNLFLENKMVAGPVFNVEQVVNDEHIAGVRNMFTTVNLEGYGEIKITNQTVKLSKTPAVVKNPPALGQHNLEVYTSLGYTEEEVNEMKKEGVI
jgi:crotonobetainyl-CoA:carnitine CoA-transferase CaiB-like acyl-CoA transferase